MFKRMQDKVKSRAGPQNWRNEDVLSRKVSTRKKLTGWKSWILRNVSASKTWVTTERVSRFGVIIGILFGFGILYF